MLIQTQHVSLPLKVVEEAPGPDEQNIQEPG